MGGEHRDSRGEFTLHSTRKERLLAQRVVTNGRGREQRYLGEKLLGQWDGYFRVDFRKKGKSGPSPEKGIVGSLFSRGRWG